MTITKIISYKYSIPMVPFTIATGTMEYAQNTLIKVYTNNGLIGYGECSAFPMIVGETQDTCFAMAKDFSNLWLHKSALNIEERMNELHLFTAGNATIKSAFDMALYDLNAKNNNQSLVDYLGGQVNNYLLSDITVGINDAELMASQAKAFCDKGAKILKIKLGKNAIDDIERIKKIREIIGENILIRIDANQGYSFEDACIVLQNIEQYKIQFCEQPMRTYNDHLLPQLIAATDIPIMVDESVYNHYDAERIIRTNSCDYVNIKIAKSGGILEALKINAICEQNNIKCMMGGMLESRLALSAFAAFAASQKNVHFYDMDTCLLGHKLDPVLNGVQYNGYEVLLNKELGIGATVNEDYLTNLDKRVIE